LIGKLTFEDFGVVSTQAPTLVFNHMPPRKSKFVGHACLKFCILGHVSNMLACVCKTLSILLKCIAIGTYLYASFAICINKSNNWQNVEQNLFQYYQRWTF